MEPRKPSLTDIFNNPGCQVVVFKAPEGMEDNCDAVEALLFPETREIKVAWMPSEVDLARLAHGGTIWLTVTGGLPPHRLEVTE